VHVPTLKEDGSVLSVGVSLMVMIIDISTYAEAMREEMIAAVFMVIVLN
jgi:hypothetical protein